MRNLRAAIAPLATALVLSAASSAQADPVSEGHELVVLYCAGCHAVEATGDSPLALAPPFRELHQRYDVEFLSEALVEGIVTAHPEMPAFEFAPEQAAAIVAYLKTFEAASPAQ